MCAACPPRDRCTTATTGRVVTIRPHHDLQASARHKAATDPAWQDDCRRRRPMVERAVAWLVARGNRRLRRRPQPPPPHQPRPHPHQRHLGPCLDHPITRG
ncbi:transposase [Nonomuraea wenchangensis]